MSNLEDRLVGTFLELVRIYSPSGAESECARYCEEALSAAGCEVHYDDSAALTGSDTGNLIATLPGSANGTLVLSAHMDVVEPCRGIEPVIEDGRIFSAGDTVLGSDDKAGIAAAIECVRRLSESSGPFPTVVCAFTVQEEVGLVGAKHLVPSDISGDLCLVLDAAGSPGGMVVGAPTHYTFDARFIGKAAHAGVEPEKGVSAILMAADAISTMPFGRLDESTTANVGRIEGGGATNIVASTISVTGECRSLDRERVETVRQSMDDAIRGAARKHGGTVEVTWALEYEGFRLDEHTPVLDMVRLACEDVNLESSTFTTGGGSDANVIAALGIPTLALSCGMTGVHGTSEEITVADMAALTDLCVAVARRLAR